MSFSSKKTAPTNIDLDSSQTLDNKTLTGSTIIEDGATITTPDIINPDRLDVKQDTQANLESYALTATDGQMCFATDTKQMYQIVDNTLAPVGGGSGGLDVFYTETFEGAVKSADFTSGNDAVYDNGGTLDGTLADETSAPISKTTSLKYTMGASSTNDFIKSPAISLDDKQKGSTVGLTFYYTYDGDSDDIKIVAYDDTGSEVLTTDLDLLKSADKPQRMSVQFPVPSNSTTLNWGIQVVTGNSGAILVVDDVEISTSPYVSKGMMIAESYRTYEHAGYGSTATRIPHFTNIEENSISQLGIITNDSTDGFSFTATKRCSVEFNYTGILTGDNWIGISVNGTVNADIDNASQDDYRVALQNTNGNNLGGVVSTSVILEVGDTIRPHTRGQSALGEAHLNGVTLIATAESNHIIAYNSRNAKNSMVRLHTGNGHGSTNTRIPRYTTVVDDIGSAITYTDSATDGASFTINEDGVYMVSSSINGSAATEVGISLNSTQLTTSIATISAADRLGSSTTPSSGYVQNTNWTGTLVKGDIVRPHTEGSPQTSSAICNFTITKIGTGDLLGVPVPRTCYIKDVKSNNTGGGTFTSGSWQTRDLNTLEGDTEFVSLSSNQFTLPAGKYEIEAHAPAYQVDNNLAKLRNITTSSDVFIGTGTRASNANAQRSISSLRGSIEITSTQTFEIQHRCTTTQADRGFGHLMNYGVDEIYTQVKIKKLP